MGVEGEIKLVDVELTRGLIVCITTLEAAQCLPCMYTHTHTQRLSARIKVPWCTANKSLAGHQYKTHYVIRSIFFCCLLFVSVIGPPWPCWSNTLEGFSWINQPQICAFFKSIHFVELLDYESIIRSETHTRMHTHANRHGTVWWDWIRSLWLQIKFFNHMAKPATTSFLMSPWEGTELMALTVLLKLLRLMSLIDAVETGRLILVSLRVQEKRIHPWSGQHSSVSICPPLLLLLLI